MEYSKNLNDNHPEVPSTKRERQREILNKFIDTPINFLIKHEITPNFLSYLGFISAALAALFIGMGTLHLPVWFAWPAPFFLFLSGMFDVFDGEVARRTGREGAKGAFLDSNLDRVSDAMLILGLIIGGYFNFIIGYTILFLILMISYIRSRAEVEGVDMKGVGRMERAERLIFLFFAIIIETWVVYITTLLFSEPLLIFIPIFSRIEVSPFFIGFIIVYSALLILTIWQRVSHTFKYLSNRTFD